MCLANLLENFLSPNTSWENKKLSIGLAANQVSAISLEKLQNDLFQDSQLEND